jgi:formate dehydrogenase major subunit
VLIKRTEREKRRGSFTALASGSNKNLDRRAFLRRSGLAASGLAALGALPLTSVRKAKAGPPAAPGAAVAIHKNICTHCAVGCTVTAEVSNGVWIGQEPSWDSPINRGSHCAKGASVRELVHSERRLKYPMKLVNGEWTRIKWDEAIDEIGNKMLEIREKSGPDLYTGWDRRNSPTKALISSEKLRRSGGPTTTTIRRVSVIRPLSPA